MDVKKIFDDCNRALESYKSAVNSVLADYRVGVERATSEVAAFKDERAELAKRKTALLNTARAEIRRADAELHNRVSGQIPKLREALSAYITAKPDSNFMEMLRDVKTFHLTLSRSELEVLVPSAEGNFTALKALQSVANDNGYSLTVPDIAAFLDDVKAIERVVRTPVMYAPAEYLHEALDVLSDKPVFRDDGGVANFTGRPDSIYLLLRQQEFDGMITSLDEMSGRWSGSFVPRLNELSEIERDGETISPEQQRAEAINAASERVSVVDNSDVERAAEWGRSKAEENAKAAEGLSYYIP